jgi:hypothetical protein
LYNKVGILISVNDTTILAMLSRYPDLPSEEVDEHILKIENAENIPICHAVVGRIDPSQLDENSRIIYEEFQNWSLNRTRRFRNDQISARQKSKNTREVIFLTQLHQQGRVSDEFMILYGIQGEFPEQHIYNSMTISQKADMLANGMEDRLGPNWKNRFGAKFKTIEHVTHNWMDYGF